MINLDPRILDQEGVRKHRRRKLFSIAALPLILLIAGGLFFLRPAVFDALFGINYNNEKSDFIIGLSQIHKNANLLEPYIAYYNAGTAYLKNNENAKAEEELRESIKNVPPSDKICQVRVNLSYSIEAQGDEARVLKKYDEALVLYNKAEGVLYEDNCASKQSSKESRDQKAQAAKNRISDKRNSTVSEMNGNEAGGGDGDDDDDNGLEISDEQLEQLRQNAMNGNDARGRVLQRRNGSAGGGYNFNTRHW